MKRFSLLLLFPVMAGAQTVQGWHYDESQHGGLRITVANDSRKEITAYNLRVIVTHSDGSKEVSDCTRDLITQVIATELSPELRKQLGNGGIPPGSVDYYLFGQDKTVTNIEATLTAVVYLDGSTDAKDARALRAIRFSRAGIVLAMQKAEKILGTARTPAEAARRIDAEAKALHKQNDQTLGAAASYLSVIQGELAETPDLLGVLQRSIPLAQVHARGAQ